MLWPDTVAHQACQSCGCHVCTGCQSLSAGEAANAIVPEPVRICLSFNTPPYHCCTNSVKVPEHVYFDFFRLNTDFAGYICPASVLPKIRSENYLVLNGLFTVWRVRFSLSSIAGCVCSREPTALWSLICSNTPPAEHYYFSVAFTSGHGPQALCLTTSRAPILFTTAVDRFILNSNSE